METIADSRHELPPYVWSNFLSTSRHNHTAHTGTGQHRAGIHLACQRAGIPLACRLPSRLDFTNGWAPSLDLGLPVSCASCHYCSPDVYPKQQPRVNSRWQGSLITNSVLRTWGMRRCQKIMAWEWRLRVDVLTMYTLWCFDSGEEWHHGIEHTVIYSTSCTRYQVRFECSDSSRVRCCL